MSLIPFVTIQQHHICFVIGLFVCSSTLRRPLPRICGSSEAALLNSYIPCFLYNSGIKLDRSFPF